MGGKHDALASGIADLHAVRHRAELPDENARDLARGLAQIEVDRLSAQACPLELETAQRTQGTAPRGQTRRDGVVAAEVPAQQRGGDHPGDALGIIGIEIVREKPQQSQKALCLPLRARSPLRDVKWHRVRFQPREMEDGSKGPDSRAGLIQCRCEPALCEAAPRQHRRRDSLLPQEALHLDRHAERVLGDEDRADAA